MKTFHRIVMLGKMWAGATPDKEKYKERLYQYVIACYY